MGGLTSDGGRGFTPPNAEDHASELDATMAVEPPKVPDELWARRVACAVPAYASEDGAHLLTCLGIELPEVVDDGVEILL